MLEAALKYAAMGWYVFPVRERDKVPLIVDWERVATRDPDIIRNWWTITPKANIGVACGPSELVIVDIDSRESWKRVSGQTDLALIGPASKTGRGGRHLVFSSGGERIKTGANVLGPGIDVRASGGMFVVPPSIHPNGNVYEWIKEPSSDLRIPEIPRWLRDRLSLRKKGSLDKDTGDGAFLIPEGERNTYLAKLAGALRRYGAPLSVLEATLKSANSAMLEVPLEHAEVSRIAASIARYDPSEAPIGPMTLEDFWGELILPGQIPEEVPSPQYTVEGLIRKASVVCVYGAPGSLKSMLLMHLAVLGGSGHPWFGRSLDFEEGALWLDLDQGKWRCIERMRALLNGANEKQAKVTISSMPPNWFDLRDDGNVDMLVDLVHKTRAGLVILDNLSQASGGADENSAEMVSVMAGLRRVSEETGATMITIHHATKSQAGGDKRRIGDRLRGHSSIEASLDLALLIDREEGSDTISIIQTKTRDEYFPKMVVEWRFELKDEGGLDKAWFSLIGEGADVGAYSPGDVETFIVNFIRNKPNVGKTELIKAIQDETNLSRSSARAAVNRCVNRNLIEEVDEGNKTGYKAYDGANLLLSF